MNILTGGVGSLPMKVVIGRILPRDGDREMLRIEVKIRSRFSHSDARHLNSDWTEKAIRSGFFSRRSIAPLFQEQYGRVKC